MCKSTVVNETVERIPFDYYVLGLLTNTYNCEVGDCNFKLFFIDAGSDCDALGSGSFCVCKEIERLLNCAEYVVGATKVTAGTHISRIYKCLNHTIFIGSDFNVSDVNHYCCRNAISGDCKCLLSCFGRIKACDFIIVNSEFNRSVAASSNYDNGETLCIKLFAKEIEFLEAMVKVYTVACSGVLRKLFDSVKSESDRIGSKYAYLILNGSIVLIGNDNVINAFLAHINCRRVDSHLRKVKGIGFAVFKYCIKSYTFRAELIACKEIGLSGCDKLKSAFGRYCHYAGKVEIEYVLSSAVLTAGDDPITLSHVKLDLNYRATVICSVKFNIVNSTVGSCNSNKLRGSTAGAVLNKEVKLTCTGNGNLNLGCRVSDLYGLVVFNALKGLCSVSDLGA